MARFQPIYNVLLAAEAAIALAAVILFCSAYPDRFRTILWENGGVVGFNSNPRLRIYFYANYQEPPEVPLIWSQRHTTSNMAVAILTMTILVTRTILSRIDYLPSYMRALYDGLLFSLWIVSIDGQLSGDYSDPEHPSRHPWYLTKSCSASWNDNKHGCRMAQASFVVATLAALLFATRLLVQLVEATQGWYGAKYRPRGYKVEGDSLMSDFDDEEFMAEYGGWNDQPLSPVLAFFPSSTKSGSKK